MSRIGFAARALAALAATAGVVLSAGGGSVSAATAGYTSSVFASGAPLGFSNPDDITAMNGVIYVAYQNGVGSMGEPSPTGNTRSAVVAYTAGGAAPADVPAVYLVHLDAGTARLTPYFSDTATASVANAGQTGTTQLRLTDPDSTGVVPPTSPRFAGDFVLDSQGDQQQIYAHGLSGQQLSVLNLGLGGRHPVDHRPGRHALRRRRRRQQGGGGARRLHAGDRVHRRDAGELEQRIATPPPNYLGTINLQTGAVTPLSVSGASVQPHALLYVPGS